MNLSTALDLLPVTTVYWRRLSSAQYSLSVQNRGLKHHSFVTTIHYSTLYTVLQHICHTYRPTLPSWFKFITIIYCILIDPEYCIDLWPATIVLHQSVIRHHLHQYRYTVLLICGCSGWLVLTYRKRLLLRSMVLPIGRVTLKDASRQFHVSHIDQRSFRHRSNARNEMKRIVFWATIFCTEKLYWAGDIWDNIHLEWIMPQMQARWLNQLTCSPACYHCATAAPFIYR